MTNLSYEKISLLLRCDADAGKLFWLPRTPDMFIGGKYSPDRNCKAWNAHFADKEAFTSLNSTGYRNGAIYGVTLLAHRVIWLMHYGEWPVWTIDHINGIRDDNRINNLRDVPQSLNGKNKKLPATNTSGVIGVHWHRATNKWASGIKVGGRQEHLGLFDTLEDATSARRAAEAYHGFHDNHGRLDAIEARNDRRSPESRKIYAAEVAGRM